MKEYFQPYHDIIARHLKGRTTETIRLKENGEPKYVSDMLRECLTEVRKKNPNAELEDLLRIERGCSGHIDYHEKLALRMHVLAGVQAA